MDLILCRPIPYWIRNRLGPIQLATAIGSSKVVASISSKIDSLRTHLGHSNVELSRKAYLTAPAGLPPSVDERVVNHAPVDWRFSIWRHRGAVAVARQHSAW